MEAAANSNRQAAAPSLRHPLLVSLVATGMWAVALTSYSSVGKGVIAASMSVVLVVLAAIDLERRIIPNVIVLPATAIILVANVLVSPAHAASFVLAAVGAGLVFAIPSLINRSWMGMGDAKLAAFLGAGLGTSVLAAVTIGFIAVFPFALGTVIRGGLAARKTTLPFGPFLALGGLVVLIVPRLVGGG